MSISAKNAIVIRFNLLQRIRVLFGHRVYVILDAACIYSHEEYVSRNDTFLGVPERLQASMKA